MPTNLWISRRASGRSLRLALRVALLCVLPAPLAAQPSARYSDAEPARALQRPSDRSSQQPATLFRNARVFDCERVLARHDVLVEAGRLDPVGRGPDPPAGAAVVHASARQPHPSRI